jgi:nucleotide-binding universal stress UspA family protein
VTHGNPAFELIRQAVRGGHDLVVKAARGRDVRHMTSFGSTALHLVRKSPVPVLLMSPDRRLLEAPKVLCAVELDDAAEGDVLNRQLLRSAAHLADSYDADLHVIHVADPVRTSVYRAFLSEESYSKFTAERQSGLLRDFEALLASELSGRPRVHAHLRSGNPSDVLTDLVASERFSHLVMGSVGHHEEGVLMGSLAEDVLSRVECCVLTLKPSSFKSPVPIDLSTAA